MQCENPHPLHFTKGDIGWVEQSAVQYRASQNAPNPKMLQNVEQAPIACIWSRKLFLHEIKYK
jgi:hypothetical protein